MVCGWYSGEMNCKVSAVFCFKSLNNREMIVFCVKKHLKNAKNALRRAKNKENSALLTLYLIEPCSDYFLIFTRLIFSIHRFILCFFAVFAAVFSVFVWILWFSCALLQFKAVKTKVGSNYFCLFPAVLVCLMRFCNFVDQTSKVEKMRKTVKKW